MNLLTRLFPLSVLLFSAVAYQFPTPFQNITPHIPTLLMVIMVSMAATVSMDELYRVLSHPAPLITGLTLQYLIMPLAAYVTAKVLRLPPDLTAGIVLVGCVASGTASSVITYLARGDVALSLVLSAFSALIGVLATPLLTHLYLDSSAAIDMNGTLIDINRWHWRHFSLQIVTLPIGVGLLVNHCFGCQIERIKSWLPLIAIVAILLVIAATVATTSRNLWLAGPILPLGIILHNTIGLVGGYWISRILGFKQVICRTLSIEVGMQNSGLALALCRLYFTPTAAAFAAVPASLFSIWHNISGTLLADFWSRRSFPLTAQDRQPIVRQKGQDYQLPSKLNRFLIALLSKESKRKTIRDFYYRVIAKNFS